MPIGIVQYFIKTKGYGFIRIPETKEEIYVQQKHLLTSIEKGDQVSFEVGEDRHGLFAINVQKI